MCVGGVRRGSVDPNEMFKFTGGLYQLIAAQAEQQQQQQQIVKFASLGNFKSPKNDFNDPIKVTKNIY